MSRPYYTTKNFVAMNSLGYLVKRCAAMMMALAENVFVSQTLSFTQWIVLMNLYGHHSHMSATELSKETGHDMGALTRVVDILENAGLVKRERSVQDRRAVEITLTAAGRREVESTKCMVMDMTNQLLESFSYDEVHTLITMLQRLFERLEHFTSLPPEQLPQPHAPASAPDKARPGSRTNARGKKS
jgi:DNA-binding MarR family transcriptional regulator